LYLFATTLIIFSSKNILHDNNIIWFIVSLYTRTVEILDPTILILSFYIVFKLLHNNDIDWYHTYISCDLIIWCSKRKKMYCSYRCTVLYLLYCYLTAYKQEKKWTYYLFLIKNNVHYSFFFKLCDFAESYCTHLGQRYSYVYILYEHAVAVVFLLVKYTCGGFNGLCFCKNVYLNNSISAAVSLFFFIYFFLITFY